MAKKLNFNQTEEAQRNRLAAMVDDAASEMPLLGNRGPDQFEGRKALREACTIRTERIIADPGQPRQDFDEEPLEQLAASIKAKGILQPLRVRWDPAEGMYVVVVGERRLRAARRVGLDAVPCVVVSGELSAAEILEDQLIENAIRQDLKPAEHARAIRTLMEHLELNQEQVAAKLHMSPGRVCQLLALTTLPKAVQDQVDDGKLPSTSAYAISMVPDATAQQELAERAVAEDLPRAEVERQARQAAGRAQGRGVAKGKGKGKSNGQPRLPAQVKDRSNNGVRVLIQTTARHGWTDVADALREIAARMDQKAQQATQDAA
jgi:ParB family chromosome partitioning protein